MMAKFKCVCVCVCVCVSVCVRERERERERGRERERERITHKPKTGGGFRTLAVNRVLRLSVARLQHTIVETATEQIQASTAIFLGNVLSD